MKKVVVGLSGGVDSSVAAYLLKKQGFGVFGVMLRLEPPECANRCCKEAPARLVCKKLGIPFDIVDVSASFKEQVINYFKAELESGRTPNPCVPCNRFVKFGLFFDVLDKKYPEHWLATGHYVRKEKSSRGAWRLLRGKNRLKDQSYFLHTLTQEKLVRLIFPLGDIKSKDEVRKIAEELGLPTAKAAESQDICFQMPKIKASPGPIKNAEGKVLGRHKGLPFYTVGQREGLGVSGVKPYYVLAKDAKENSLLVGAKEKLYKSLIRVKNISLISGEYAPRRFEASIAVRYHAEEVSGIVSLKEGRRAVVKLREPALSPTPGQFAVFYRGGDCLGGGVIEV